ncbi:MAG: hypothetical protein LC721_03115, partial [Actinobacteria bacterium]|nr:hypothetical protein [Actinomycetota bacterium]
ELWDDDDQEIGFAARIFCQLTLPYKDPGNMGAWVRCNGTLALSIQPRVVIGDDGKSYRFEYPYGSIPRLVLTWLATEAVRTKRPELTLGENLADFMRQLGLSSKGGVRGDITRLRSQLNRLLGARMTIEDYGDPHRDVGLQLQVGYMKDLWGSDTDRDADQRSLLPSTVVLSREFFDHITASPVPISLDALRALRGSPLRLDIYTWLVHRMFYLRRRTTVSWEQLRAQFGSQYADTRSGRFKFKKDFERHLAAVVVVYRDANVEATPTGVILRPSRTHIAVKAGLLR